MRKKIQKGFTIIELLIYMGLLSILLLVLTTIFTNIIDVQLESASTSAVEQDGRFILSRLTYDMNRAKAIISPAKLSSQSATLILNIGGTNFTYGLNGTNLQLTDNIGTDNLNSFDSSISNLNFQYIANNNSESTNSATINLSFTLTSKTVRREGPETLNFQTTLGLRQR